MKDYVVGIDLGSRAVKGVLINTDEKKLVARSFADAGTNPKCVAESVYSDLLEKARITKCDVSFVTTTGYGRYSPDFSDKIATEITCHALGAKTLIPDAKTIIDIGGQDSKAIFLDDKGQIKDFIMNDRCAAGTGRFFEVVAKILETDSCGVSELAMNADSQTEISSMCVVFAESEVIGLLAKGTSRENISAGIHVAIARRIASMTQRGKIEAPIVFTGGVALNNAMRIFLGNELKERLIVPADPRLTGALGAAIISAKQTGAKIKPGELYTNIIGCKESEEMCIDDCCSKDKPKKTECCGDTKPIKEVCCESNEPKNPCCEPEPVSCCEPKKEESPCCGETKSASSPCCGSEPAPSSCCGEEQPKSSCCESGETNVTHSVPALGHFDRMVSNCIDTAQMMKNQGKKIVSMFCEYTPRELIMAAGAIPVCACGGSHNMAAASERDLPSNLCPVIKSSYGFALEKANPIFEMSDLVIAETTCDGKKKMYELLSKDKPMHILELTQKPDEESAFQHWFTEIKLLVKKLEDLTGNKITDERLREAIELMNKERSLRLRISEFGGTVLTGREVLDAKALISGIPCDIKAYEDTIAEAEKACPKHDHKPKVLMTGVPLPHGAEKVLDIIEEAGAVVCSQENCTGIKPLVDNISTEGDLLENLARKYFKLPCSVMMPNEGRFDLLDEMIAKHKPDGIVDLIWQACHTYNIESELLKKHVQEKHNLPFLKIETDYSPSDAGQLRLRIDSFLAMIEK